MKPLTPTLRTAEGAVVHAAKAGAGNPPISTQSPWLCEHGDRSAYLPFHRTFLKIYHPWSYSTQLSPIVSQQGVVEPETFVAYPVTEAGLRGHTVDKKEVIDTLLALVIVTICPDPPRTIAMELKDRSESEKFKKPVEASPVSISHKCPREKLSLRDAFRVWTDVQARQAVWLKRAEVYKKWSSEQQIQEKHER